MLFYFFYVIIITMIENLTEYNENLLKQLIEYTTKKSRIITYITCLLLLSFAVLLFVIEMYVIGIVLLLMSIFFLFANIFVIKKSFKNIKKVPKFKYLYQFYPENLKIKICSMDEELETVILPYDVITKFVEYKDVMYLYINKNQVLLINICNFENLEDKEIMKRYIQNKGNIKY